MRQCVQGRCRGAELGPRQWPESVPTALSGGSRRPGLVGLARLSSSLLDPINQSSFSETPSRRGTDLPPDL